MYVVYVHPNDGTDTVTLATKRTKKAAIRTIVERDVSIDVRLASYPRGKVVIRHAFANLDGTLGSHVVRSWDVSKLVPLQDPRDSAAGTGSVRAYGVNMKGRVSGRVFRTNGIADTIGAQACLSKHPVCEGHYPSTRSHAFAHLRDDESVRFAEGC